MDNIAVSVICTTYNHVQYIHDCLDSIVCQDTNFSYEVLVHDDASSDGTAEVIEEYQSRFKSLIVLFKETENQFSKGFSGIDIMLAEAKGKYIAICEGDDYWTDSLKLQKQYDFMESNPGYSLLLHNAVVLDYRLNLARLSNPRYGSSEKSLCDIIREGGGTKNATASFFFRKELLSDDRVRGPVGDHFIMMDLARKGKVFYCDEAMSAYRFGSQGSFTEGARMKNIDQITLYHDRYVSGLKQLKDLNGASYGQAFDDRIALQESTLRQQLLTNVFLTEGIIRGFVSPDYQLSDKTVSFLRGYLPVELQKRLMRIKVILLSKRNGTLIASSLDKLPKSASPACRNI